MDAELAILAAIESRYNEELAKLERSPKPPAFDNSLWKRCRQSPRASTTAMTPVSLPRRAIENVRAARGRPQAWTAELRSLRWTSARARRRRSNGTADRRAAAGSSGDDAGAARPPDQAGSRHHPSGGGLPSADERAGCRPDHGTRLPGDDRPAGALPTLPGCRRPSRAEADALSIRREEKRVTRGSDISGQDGEQEQLESTTPIREAC